MKQYHDLLSHVLEFGERRSDRTGTGTMSVFGYQMRFNLSEGFPLVTTKKLHMKSVVHELLWFLRGDTNVNYLQKNGVSIWNEWARENGELGPVYGYQWRHWGSKYSAEHPKPDAGNLGIDQITRLVRDLKENPYSRRHIVNAWNVSDIDQMALPPCHTMFQFYVHGDKRLSCQLYQRSADIFLGVPFNIASYSLLLMMVAAQTGLRPGDFVHTFGDAHLYTNHVEQARLQLSRTPKALPQLILNPDVPSIFDYKYEDFTLQNYDPHPGIKADIAV